MQGRVRVGSAPRHSPGNAAAKAPAVLALRPRDDAWRPPSAPRCSAQAAPVLAAGGDDDRAGVTSRRRRRRGAAWMRLPRPRRWGGGAGAHGLPCPRPSRKGNAMNQRLPNESNPGGSTKFPAKPPPTDAVLTWTSGWGSFNPPPPPPPCVVWFQGFSKGSGRLGRNRTKHGN